MGCIEDCDDVDRVYAVYGRPRSKQRSRPPISTREQQVLTGIVGSLFSELKDVVSCHGYWQRAGLQA